VNATNSSDVGVQRQPTGEVLLEKGADPRTASAPQLAVAATAAILREDLQDNQEAELQGS